MLQSLRTDEMDKMNKIDTEDIVYLAAILATTGLGRAKLPALVQEIGRAHV